MKKILLLGILVTGVVFPPCTAIPVAYATTDATASVSSDVYRQTLLRLVELLTQQVTTLTAQLAVENAEVVTSIDVNNTIISAPASNSVLTTEQISRAVAVEFYVHAGVGNDSNTGTSPNDAFGTLKHAMRQLSPGDTLYLRAGEYGGESIYATAAGGFSSGTQSQPIKVTAYESERPVLNTESVFLLGDLSWWIVENLTFEKETTFRLGNVRPMSMGNITHQCVETAKNIVVRDNLFQHKKGGMTVACAEDITIEDNRFDNLRSRVAGIDNHAITLSYKTDDIYIEENVFTDIGADGIHLLNNPGSSYTDVYITDNDFSISRPYSYRNDEGFVETDQWFGNVGENAIDIKIGPGPIVIEGNTISGFLGTKTGQDASGANGAGIVVHLEASGVTIKNNTMFDNQKHIVLARGSYQADRSQLDLEGSLVANNILEDLIDPNLVAQGKTSAYLTLQNAKNFNVFNNTFINNTSDKRLLLSISKATSFQFVNNALENGKVAINYDSLSPFNGDYNAWSQVESSDLNGVMREGVYGENDIFPDTLSIDLQDYTPRSDSLLINAGENVGRSRDYYNNSLVEAADIGAVEYQTPTPISPELDEGTMSEEEADDQEEQREEEERIILDDDDGTERTALLARIAELTALLESLRAPTTAPSNTETYQFNKYVTLGEEDVDVLNLQKKLNSLGFMVAAYGPGSPGNETNYYGPATTAALKRFQCAYDIVCFGTHWNTGFGNFGPQTRARLNDL